MEIKNEEEQKLAEVKTEDTAKKGNRGQRAKKTITVLAVVLCVGAAAYLNWSYNKSAGLSDAESVGLTALDSADDSGATEETASNADYFAQARLTRKQSRDEALSLLKSTAASKTASKETIDGAMSAISAMANASMEETQIENLLLAKDFSECVAFVSADGVTLAVPAPAEGLSAADVAKITDTVTTETDFKPTQIKVIEVRDGKGAAAGGAAAASPAAGSQAPSSASAAPGAKTSAASAAPAASPAAADAEADDASVLE